MSLNNQLNDVTLQSMLDAALCIGHLILCAALPQVSAKATHHYTSTLLLITLRVLATIAQPIRLVSLLASGVLRPLHMDGDP